MGIKEALKKHKEWAKLYEEDPKAFEKRRKEAIEEVIRSARPEQQLKLRLLQAKWDKIMNNAGSRHNRLVLAKSILMDQFINVFDPIIQEANKKLNKK